MSANLWPKEVARHVLETVDSTNALALRRAPSLVGPAWFLGLEQTAGKGRRARAWASPRGNFHASLLLHPVEPAEQVALRSFAAALALRDALIAVTGLTVGWSLKWPNDVLLNGGKLAGILLESIGVGQGGAHLAIGFGVNLISAPPLDQIEAEALLPVSLLGETGVRIAPEVFLDALAPAYAAWETEFTANGFSTLRSAWLADAARLGETIRARSGTQTRSGVFETIDQSGNLILRTSQGPVVIPAAEVFF